MSDEKEDRFDKQKVWFNVIAVILVIAGGIGMYSRWKVWGEPITQTQATQPSQNLQAQSPVAAVVSSSRRSKTEIPSHQANESTAADDPAPVQLPKPRHPVNATSGLPVDTSMSMQECRRDGSVIACWGYIALSTDIPTYQCFEQSSAADDLGNQFNVMPGFTGGSLWLTLIPSTNYRFNVKVDDPHPAVEKVSFIIRIRQDCNTLGRYHEQALVVFPGVPVGK